MQNFAQLLSNFRCKKKPFFEQLLGNVLRLSSILWKTTSEGERENEREARERAWSARNKNIFFFPNHYPLALAVTKSPTGLYFTSRARRTLKRKKRVREQAIWIAPFLYERFEILVDVSCKNEAWEESVCGSLSVFFTPGGWHESGR